MSRKGGIISGGFQPLKAPDAPTIDSVSAGVLSADVTFSAPSNTGDGTIDSYVITAKQSDGTSASATASAAGTTSVSLTAGGTTTFAAQALSEYGPGQFSGFGNSTSVPTGQELYTWGRGSSGRTGQNDIIDRSSPVQVGSLTTWSQVSLFSHAVAIKTDGTMWTWGANSYGRLGQNNGIDVSSPVQVGSLTNWSQASAGGTHTAAIKTDGTLWTWGNNGEGELGQNIPYTTDRSSPIQVGALTYWSQVSAGGSQTLAIKTDGTLWAWGENNKGQSGLNSGTTNRSSPVQVGALTTWAQVSAGDLHTGAVKTDGTLWMWGDNGFGRLGLNTNQTIDVSSPTQVGALTTWLQVSAGVAHTCAIKTDGTLWAWGNNGSGRLGINTNQAVDVSSPVQVGALTNWSQVSAGSSHTVAVKTDGTMWAWGDSLRGAVGDGSIIFRSSPVQVGALTTWAQGAAGNQATAAIQQSFT